jgi:hypothetical protein
MRTLDSVTAVSLCLMALLTAAAAGAAEDLPPSYLDVKEWWGSYQITITGHQGASREQAGLPAAAERTVRRSCDGTFHLDRTTKGGLLLGHAADLAHVGEMQNARSWFSTFDGSSIPKAYVTVDDDFRGINEQHVEATARDTFASSDTATAHGFVRAVQAVQLVISGGKDRLYSLMLPYDAINSSELQVATRKYEWTRLFDNRFTERTHVTTRGGPFEKPRFQIDKSHNPSWITDQKLPDGEGVRSIEGKVTYSEMPIGETNPARFIQVTIKWSLEPKPPPDVELILRPNDPQEYKTWRPIGGATEEQLGNTIAVYAGLQNKDGSAPPADVKARRITFHLLEVSREPGVCINWPVYPKYPDMSDLQFCPSENRDLDTWIYDEHTAVCAHAGGIQQAMAYVSSFDFGGFALVEADAELESGRIIHAHLKGQPDQLDLRLPKSRPGSHIADGWRDATPGASGADDSDDEDNPKGDGKKGDGFTLYEEYRGYMSGNEQFCLDPAKKDFFINDNTNGSVTNGYRTFKRITGLATHIIHYDEVRSDLVVNFNCSYAHRSPQHCVWVQLGSTVVLDGFPCSVANGGPGTPGQITSVDIVPDQFGDGLRCNVAHELLHCCNVYHHGESDIRQWWQASDDLSSIHEVSVDQNGAATGRAGIINITLLDKAGHEIPVPEIFKAGKPVPVWIGKPHGQHSGEENCVMRYDVSMAYPKGITPNQYVWVFPSEPTPDSICHGIDGHDFNKPGPDTRYDSADAKRDRGKCAEQIDVNDANHPPRR